MRAAPEPQLGTAISGSEIGQRLPPRAWASLRGLRWFLVWIAIFAGIAAWRWDIHDVPPFEDQSLGLWAEADFLARTNFDYYRLRYHEGYFMDFSDPEKLAVRSYMISVMPTLVAVLMRVMPTTHDVLVAAHLVEFGCASLLLLCLWGILRPLVPRLAALLICAAVASTPLFLVQIEMVGMDLPLATCALLSALFLKRHQLPWAVSAATLAFLVKSSGLIFLAVTLAVQLMMYFGWAETSPRTSRRRLALGIGLNVFIIAAAVALMKWGDAVPRFANSDIVPVPRLFAYPQAFRLFPDVEILLGLALILATVTVWIPLVHRRRLSPAQTVLFVSWLALVLQLLGMLRWIVMPRYFTSIVPFVYVVLGIVLCSRPWSRRLAPLLFFGIMTFNLMNSHGDFYPTVAELGRDDFRRTAYVHARNCVFLERSLEYRIEHDSTIRAFQLLDSRFPDRPLLTPIPYLYYATLPRLGYVNKPREAYNAGDFTLAISKFRDLTLAARDAHTAREPILLWTNLGRITLPEPEANDALIFQGGGAMPLVVYGTHVPDSIHSSTELEDWYLDRTWPGPWLALRAAMRLSFLEATGRLDRAGVEIREALARDSFATTVMRRNLRIEGQRLASPTTPE